MISRIPHSAAHGRYALHRGVRWMVRNLILTVALTSVQVPEAVSQVLRYLPDTASEVIPAPQSLVYAGSMWSVTGKRVALVVSPGAAPSTRLIADQLAESLEALPDAGLVVERSESPPGDADLVFFLGEIAAFVAGATDGSFDFPEDYPGREGYLIRFTPLVRWVVCAGDGPLGLRYGVQTLMQLFRRHPDGEWMFRPARVTDWPVYGGRAASALSWRDIRDESHLERAVATALWLDECRFNTVAIPYLLLPGTDWRDTPAGYFTYVDAVASPLVERGMNLLLLVNPFAPDPAGPAGEPFAVSNGSDRERLADHCRLTTEAARHGPGRVHLLLCMDQFLPGPFPPWRLPSAADREAFDGIPEAAEFLLEDLHHRLSGDGPEPSMAWCPPWFSTLLLNRMRPDDGDIREAARRIPADIPWVWTGPDIRSLEVTARDVAEWKERTGRERMIFWDNAFADRWQDGRRIGSYYLADPRVVRLPAGFEETVEVYFLNNGFHGEIARIGLLDAANYLWNPGAYDAERSRVQCIERVAGPGTVEAMDTFRTAYADILAVVYPFASRGEALDGGARDRVASMLSDLRTALLRLERQSTNGALVEEFRTRLRELEPLAGIR